MVAVRQRAAGVRKDPVDAPTAEAAIAKATSPRRGGHAGHDFRSLASGPAQTGREVHALDPRSSDRPRGVRILTEPLKTQADGSMQWQMERLAAHRCMICEAPKPGAEGDSAAADWQVLTGLDGEVVGALCPTCHIDEWTLAGRRGLPLCRARLIQEAVSIGDPWTFAERRPEPHGVPELDLGSAAVAPSISANQVRGCGLRGAWSPEPPSRPSSRAGSWLRCTETPSWRALGGDGPNRTGRSRRSKPRYRAARPMRAWRAWRRDSFHFELRSDRGGCVVCLFARLREVGVWSTNGAEWEAYSARRSTSRLFLRLRARRVVPKAARSLRRALRLGLRQQAMLAAID